MRLQRAERLLELAITLYPSMTGTSGPAPAPAASASSKDTTKTKKATKAGATTAKPRKPTQRRKKTTTKASSATSSAAILADARAAQIDLAQQRSQAAARQSDPLWYRLEDILPSIADPSAMVAKSMVLPEQVSVVETALRHNGLSHADVTPQAMACLLEQARRYALELLTDAGDYAYMAHRPEPTRPDLLLAAEMRADHPVAISTQLPKLNLVAQQINRAPLPPIPSQCYSGILLPASEYQLTARTFDVVSAATVSRKMVQVAPLSPAQKKRKNVPGYGAARGRQIPIKLKDNGPKPMELSSPSGAPAPSSAPSGAAPMGAPPFRGQPMGQPMGQPPIHSQQPQPPQQYQRPSGMGPPGAPSYGMPPGGH